MICSESLYNIIFIICKIDTSLEKDIYKNIQDFIGAK